jgi:molybdenum transport protein
MALPLALSRAQLEQLLAEDAPYGDLTTETLGIGAAPGVMRFSARGAMVLALAAETAALIELAGARVTLSARDGDVLEPGAPILSAEGPADALLRAWKVAQTLIEIWSGVASAAREIVDAARAVSPDISVACTRKTTPGTKAFAVAAVRAGGAVMHRIGLSETILVFPDHLAFLPDADLSDIVARLRQQAPEKKLVAEARNPDEALRMAKAGFDVIQAEKFSAADLAATMTRLSTLPSRPLVAAAGGVKASNAADYARAGADILVTSAPYAATPRDVSVVFSRHA